MYFNEGEGIYGKDGYIGIITAVSSGYLYFRCSHVDTPTSTHDRFFRFQYDLLIDNN